MTPRGREHEDCIQVVLAFPSLIAMFEELLHARGLHLFPIPVVGDDLPTYGIAPGVIPTRLVGEFSQRKS